MFRKKKKFNKWIWLVYYLLCKLNLAFKIGLAIYVKLFSFVTLKCKAWWENIWLSIQMKWPDRPLINDDHLSWNWVQTTVLTTFFFILVPYKIHGCKKSHYSQITILQQKNLWLYIKQRDGRGKLGFDLCNLLLFSVRKQ